MANLIDGRAIAEKVYVDLRREIAELKSKGVTPGLAVVLVGDNAASRAYVRSKDKMSRELGLHSIKLELPDPSRVFEARAYGPFLVIRTRRPTVTIRRYLKLARQVEWVGVEQYLGDAFTNIFTIADASGRLARYERARNSASSASR